jgi:hypothetical protein
MQFTGASSNFFALSQNKKEGKMEKGILVEAGPDEMRL